MQDGQERNSKVFLALTSLESFWDFSRPIVLLGEWCRNPNKKYIWEKLNTQLLQSAELDYANSYEAYQYAKSTYENLLPKLVNWLNEQHNTQHSFRYWELLVGPFLFYYTQVIYQRLLYLQAAYKEYPNIETYGLSNHHFLTPINTNEFQYLARDDQQWNMQIFTQIIDLVFKKPICYIGATWDEQLKIRKMNYGNSQYSKKTKFLIFMLRILNKFERFQGIGILNGFNGKELFKLMVESKFRILPILPSIPINRGQSLSRSVLSETLIDRKKRAKLVNISVDNELSKLVINTLPINIPVNFIENYHEETTTSKKYFPYQSKVIVQEQVADHDSYKFWIGEQIEKGAKLVNYQFGGAYGMPKAQATEFLESQVSDFFISWGWHSYANVLPASFPLLNRLYSKYYRKEKQDNLSGILWVAALNDIPFHLAIQDWVITSKKYLNFQKRFFNALNKNVSSQICMRLNPASKNVEEIQEYFPGLDIYLPKNRESFYTCLNQSKLMIVDNPNTVFLYTLTFNVPTVLFWDKDYFPFRDEAKPYLEVLEKANIYHDTAESAAKMVNKIAEDPNLWWYSESVQSARQKFCDYFCKISPDYIDEWNILLSDVLLDTKREENEVDRA